MKNVVNKHINMLGLKCRDKVTGFEGVVESVSFDLYGCVQVVMRPPAKDGKIEDGRWFDIQRLTQLDSTPVMRVPSFDALATAEGDHTHGPAEKPVRG